MKLNRVEEAKALMNSYASDCLGQYRISTDPAKFIENATPDELDNVRLSTLQYQIDGDKNKCSHVAIKPLNDNEKDLYAFDFRISICNFDKSLITQLKLTRTSVRYQPSLPHFRRRR